MCHHYPVDERAREDVTVAELFGEENADADDQSDEQVAEQLDAGASPADD